MKNKFYQKGLTEIIIAIIIGVVLAAGMFIFFKIKFPPTEIPKITKTDEEANEQKTEENKEESTFSEIKNEWQTFEAKSYKGESFGFSMQVPIDYLETKSYTQDPEKDPMGAAIASFARFEHNKNVIQIMVNDFSESDLKDIAQLKNNYRNIIQNKEEYIGEDYGQNTELISIDEKKIGDCLVFDLKLKRKTGGITRNLDMYSTKDETLTFSVIIHLIPYTEEDESVISKVIDSISCSL